MKSILKNVMLSSDIYTVDDLKSNFEKIQCLNSDEVGQEEIVATINQILSAFTQKGEIE